MATTTVARADADFEKTLVSLVKNPPGSIAAEVTAAICSRAVTGAIHVTPDTSEYLTSVAMEFIVGDSAAALEALKSLSGMAKFFLPDHLVKRIENQLSDDNLSKKPTELKKTLEVQLALSKLGVEFSFENVPFEPFLQVSFLQTPIALEYLAHFLSISESVDWMRENPAFNSFVESEAVARVLFGLAMQEKQSDARTHAREIIRQLSDACKRSDVAEKELYRIPLYSPERKLLTKVFSWDQLTDEDIAFVSWMIERWVLSLPTESQVKAFFKGFEEIIENSWRHEPDRVILAVRWYFRFVRRHKELGLESYESLQSSVGARRMTQLLQEADVIGG